PTNAIAATSPSTATLAPGGATSQTAVSAGATMNATTSSSPNTSSEPDRPRSEPSGNRVGIGSRPRSTTATTAPTTAIAVTNIRPPPGSRIAGHDAVPTNISKSVTTVPATPSAAPVTSGAKTCATAATSAAPAHTVSS